jgi:hypothetical protein
MIVLGLTAAAIGTHENRPGQVFGGLPFVFYWMWRVRVRGRLRGMVLGRSSW